MRINKLIALSTGLSRRSADSAIIQGRVRLNNKPASPGAEVTANDQVTLDSKILVVPSVLVTIMLNKPPGYVVSRMGQGSQTIYNLLPKEHQVLKPVGRLDKDSSGLLLLTNDGQLANQLTHPKYAKTKVYQVKLDKKLTIRDKLVITDKGVLLADGISKFEIEPSKNSDLLLIIRLKEGRNRQIRRTFTALGYHVLVLHRTNFGNYQLGKLKSGNWQLI
ncbi:MAG TPA: pseudouridine synthase [Candidatus Dormibacteraeota bacterium]|nr:pseudouridine synthase [Candidatus Dormibacteraeota bacterium]